MIPVASDRVAARNVRQRCGAVKRRNAPAHMISRPRERAT
jgi:hypothetical protein